MRAGEYLYFYGMLIYNQNEKAFVVVNPNKENDPLLQNEARANYFQDIY